MKRVSLPAMVLLVVLILGASPGRASAQEMQPFRPEVAIQSADYAAVRRQFTTRLVRRGPAPQEYYREPVPSEVTEIEYPSGPFRLSAWLATDPRGGVRLPAVIFLHGGFSFGFDDWDMALPYWKAGFVLLVPKLRGENGQRGDFSFLYDEVDDVVAAADWLRRQPYVDSSHIYLAGHSAGATLALLTAEASGRFRAVASFDGSPDQQLLYKGRASKPGQHREVVFDTSDVRELEVRSPLAYAGSLKSPVRLYYSGEAAPLYRLPTERLVAIAQARGLDVRATRIAGTHMSHVAAAMERSIRFFRQHLDSRSARLLHARAVPPRLPSRVGNTTFKLDGHERARSVTVAGSFNGWNRRSLPCGRERTTWICRTDLDPGKYYYRFVVDDDWILDPANPSEPDADGNVNSVIVRTAP